MILVNALVEWILISLLLLNSLFTYLIIKYAHYFGLNLKLCCSTPLTHLNLKPNTTIQHNNAPNICYCHPSQNSQHIIEEELDIVDGDNDHDQLEQAHHDVEHQILSDEEEEDDAHNHNILLLLLLLLQSNSHLEKLDNEDDAPLQLIHLKTTHYCTHSLRPVPLDLIDSLTMDTVHLFQQVTHPRHPQLPHAEDDQLHKEKTPLQLEADGESSQVKPLSYRDDRDSANGEKEARDTEPETPTSLDSPHNNNNNNNNNNDKQLLLSEKRDSSSVTVERLKSALTSERKTLRAVYTELEEERSASEIAANHTMAMITRLQEEKAAMLMEALQYQRMMEEQAEYDREALQLLNQLMLKKEKEKDELTKELEMYRENQNIVKEGDYTDDDDDTRLSIDLNRAMIEKHTSDYNYDGSSICDDDEDLEVMTLDCMKHMSELGESLAEFEEEKLSILDQLKALEEKLFMMSGEGSEGRIKGRDIEDVQKETMQFMAKQLLPLLDEAEDNESSEIEMNLVEEFPDDDDENDAKKVDGVEELDRVYERLKALEEETVKEDKQGMNILLQEILHNLQDLKTVELRVQSTGIAL